MNIEKLDTKRHDLQLVSELIYETDKDLFRIFLDENHVINCYGCTGKYW